MKPFRRLKLFPFVFVASLCVATQAAGEVSHGLSYYGDLKYPADFTHLDYVNPDAPKGGSLTYPRGGTFNSLNPFIRKGSKPTGMTLTSGELVYERLMYKSTDEPASFYGNLAAKVELAADYSWITFFLRPQARWHDGNRITAKDVVFTFERIKELGSPALKSAYRQIVSAEETGAGQVTFHFKNSRSAKDAQTIAGMLVIPEHYWRDRNFDETTLEIPIGSGPYRIVELDPGRKIVYQRVEDYWGKDLPVNKGRHNFDRITYDYFGDPSVIHEAHKSGAVDARIEMVSKNWALLYDFPAVKEGLFIKELIKVESPHGINQGLTFNLRKPKFQDVRVREALSLAYNFEWSNRVLYHDFYRRNVSFFDGTDMASSGLPSAAELELLKPFRDQIPTRVFTEEFRPAVGKARGYPRENLLRALELFEQAGWVVRDNQMVNAETGEPFTVELLMVAAALVRTMIPFKAALNRLGIKARVQLTEVSLYRYRLGEFDFEMTTAFWRTSFQPGLRLRTFFGSATADTKFTYNQAGITDPAVDALIMKVIMSRSRPQLVTAARALDRVLLWNFYAIPGYVPPGSRFVYWDKFDRPERGPLYSSGFPDTWWENKDKAARLKQLKSAMRTDRPDVEG
ncbi:MAG: extracellular solute-binding protein [Pseudomonadales bacterium]|jgi:microcin C transport system substrate-binding protein|nr:extracellular solute-binding protein [Pseudomonadales bacterium]|tara:strand:- start:964 stop:2844 length:1881 start_codon:yes stop_codon:yes gene_type:complete